MAMIGQEHLSCPQENLSEDDKNISKGIMHFIKKMIPDWILVQFQGIDEIHKLLQELATRFDLQMSV